MKKYAQEKMGELMTFFDVLRYVKGKLKLDIDPSALKEDTVCKYYPYDTRDPEKGFIEVLFPDAVGLGLRGASGNGPIFVFHIFKGCWKPLRELNGAWVNPNFKIVPTGLNACGHISAFEHIEYSYVLRSGKYVCVRERHVRE